MLSSVHMKSPFDGISPRYAQAQENHGCFTNPRYQFVDKAIKNNATHMDPITGVQIRYTRNEQIQFEN